MRQRIESLEQFRALQAEYMAAREAEKRKILVCCGTGCVAGGNLNVYHELKKRMDELGIPCEVSLTEPPRRLRRPEKVRVPRLLRDGTAGAHRAPRAGCTPSARSATWRRSSRRPSSAGSSSSASATIGAASSMSGRRISRFTSVRPAVCLSTAATSTRNPSRSICPSAATARWPRRCSRCSRTRSCRS